MPQEEVLTDGVVERIGMEDAIFTIRVNGEKVKSVLPIKDHQQAVDMLLEALVKHKIVNSLDEINGVGHRVLHGGKAITESVLVDEKAKSAIRDAFELGPLHNPANLMGIEACEKVVPGKKNVAVFDTEFGMSLPEKAYLLILYFS